MRTEHTKRITVVTSHDGFDFFNCHANFIIWLKLNFTFIWRVR